jgi:hypothetical protein
VAQETWAIDGPARDVAAAEAYLRANAGRYRPQDLDLQLRAAGHGEATIAEAWRRLSPFGSPLADRPPRMLAGFVHSVGIIVLGVMYGVLILALAGGAIGSFSGGQSALAFAGAVPVVVLVTAWVLGTRRLTSLRAGGAGVGATLLWLGILGGTWLIVAVVIATPFPGVARF